MLRYELKKIFAGKGNRIALFLLVVFWGVSCYCAVTDIDVNFTDGQGKSGYGYFAAQKLREAQKAWTGPLTEETVAAVIEKNARIIATPEYNADDVARSNIAYGWMQDYRDIRNIINCAFCEFRTYDYYRINSLTPADAADFYPNRLAALKTWLDTEAKDLYSDEEKAFFIGHYKNMKTPLYYTWKQGWESLLEHAAMPQMFLVLTLSFVAAGLFAGEFSNRADAVFFTACHGRGKAIKAKLGAGVLFVTGAYWIVWGAYSLFVLGTLGADGASCMIQTGLGGWKSFYNISYGQLYLLASFGGYAGVLFFLFLTMLVSAWSRSATVAVTVPFVLIFLPSVLDNLGSDWMSKLTGLLPDQLFQMDLAVRYFNLYCVGGRLMGALPILFTVYTALALLCLPVCYRVFRRAGIGR